MLRDASRPPLTSLPIDTMRAADQRPAACRQRCARVGHQVPRAGASTLQAVEAQGEVAEAARCGRVDQQCSRVGLETVTPPAAVAQDNVCSATAIVATPSPVLLNACTRASLASLPATSPSQHRGFLRFARSYDAGCHYVPGRGTRTKDAETTFTINRSICYPGILAGGVGFR